MRKRKMYLWWGPACTVATVITVIVGTGRFSMSGRSEATGGPSVIRAAQEAVESQAPAVDLPSLGQTDLAVYVPASGHTVWGTLLDYWRATGATAVYGSPVSEAFVDEEGYWSQVFENGVFRFIPEEVWTVDPFVRLRPIAHTALSQRLDTFRADGRRGDGGGDPRGASWRPLNQHGQTVQHVIESGGLFVEATGHSIQGEALAWYDLHEGQYYLGDPLSEPVRERGTTVQWFEGGLLRSDDSGTALLPLAREMIPTLGIDTTPVEQSGLPAFDENLFQTAANPDPDGVGDATGVKRIEVDISRQQLRAYQGDTVILTSLVSTGIDPNGTEQGRFHVRYKEPTEDMRGFTDTTGEVVWVVGDETPPPAGSIPYGVPDVPNVMYFDLDAEALHGAYWHNNFGQKMSHGCVNLPVDVAAFLYGWAPLGTQVWVHA